MPGDAPRDARGSAPELPGAEIASTLRSGTPFRGDRVVLYVRPGTGQARAAWVVGRKVGSAVARNRARRLIREAWRTLAPRVDDGNDMVIVARSPLHGVKAHDVTQEIGSLLVRAGAMA